MSTNWNDVKSPEEIAKEKEVAQKKAAQEKYLFKTVDNEDWAFLTPWGYEHQKLYKMLGFKKIKKEEKYGSYGTGEYYYQLTSSNTYEKKEKRS